MSSTKIEYNTTASFIYGLMCDLTMYHDRNCLWIFIMKALKNLTKTSSCAPTE